MIAKAALKLMYKEIMKFPFGKGEVKSIIGTAVGDSWQIKMGHRQQRETLLQYTEFDKGEGF